MPGYIQNAVNQAIRSASWGARKGASHAGQTGKDPSASAEGASVVSPQVPNASEVAGKVAKQNLNDKRNSVKMNRAIIDKWASEFNETPESMADKVKKLSEKGAK